mgnify:CR=1 FL=1
MMALLIWCSSASAQGLIIGNGVHVVTDGSPNIVLLNGNWTNNGSFAPSYSRVKMSLWPEGGSVYHLNGDSVTTFYHLLVHASQFTTFFVQTDANIIARFDFGGSLMSVDADINMLPGAVFGYDPESMVTGVNGRILTTVTLDKPMSANPANLGIEITSHENLGMTTIIRGFREQINAGGEKSIERYYDIIPATQPAQPVQLRLQYHDGELNGNSKSRLAVFSGKAGSKLSMLSQNSNESRPNWINAGSTRQLQRFTLGNALAANQSATEKVGLKAFPNPFTNRFTVTLHSDVAKSVELKMVNLAGIVIESKLVKLQAGNNYIEWSAAKYTPGAYHLVIGGDTGKAIKVVKQ